MSGGPGLSTKVARGVAWAAGAQAVIAIADLISILLVTVFWVSDKEFGIVSAVIPFYTALDYIADSGISAALIQRDDHTPEIVSTVFWFNILVSAALFVVLLGLGPLYAWIQHKPIMAWLLIAYGAKLLLQNIYAIPFALLRKDLRFSDIAIARVVAHLAESVSAGRVRAARRGDLVLHARGADARVRVRGDHADPTSVRAEARVPAARGDPVREVRRAFGGEQRAVPAVYEPRHADRVVLFWRECGWHLRAR